MDVPGPKLMDDEQFTQDLFGTSAPTFVTPDTRANAQLQHWSYLNAPIFYFFNFRETHIDSGIRRLIRGELFQVRLRFVQPARLYQGSCQR